MGENLYWDEQDQQWYSYTDKDCLFIFDWDNTLLPAKALMARGIRGCRIPNSLKVYMEGLGTRIIRMLSRAVEIGDATVISNGTHDWVRLSAARCFPDVLTFMDDNDIDIVSARDRYQNIFPNQKQLWKDKAFHEEVEEYVEDSVPTAEGLSIISIGDGQKERLATLKLTSLIPKECIKAVELEMHEDLDDFKEQIGKVHNILDAAKQSNHHLDVDI